MTAPQRLTVEDVDWVVDILATRRAALVPFAPVFWRPAADAARAHRDFLTHQLGKGGGIGWAAGSSVMVAAPGRDGWVVDDMAVVDGNWSAEGPQLWGALSDHDPGGSVRFVCPVPERKRNAFAESAGMTLLESWSHLDVPPAPPARSTHREPAVPGAVAVTVPAPPVYDPGGPILFLPDVEDPTSALPVAEIEARALGCPVVVVAHRAGDEALALALTTRGYRRHCNFWTGTLALVTS